MSVKVLEQGDVWLTSNMFSCRACLIKYKSAAQFVQQRHITIQHCMVPTQKIAFGACPCSNWAVEVLQSFVCKSLQSRPEWKSQVLLFPIYNCLVGFMLLHRATLVDNILESGIQHAGYIFVFSYFISPHCHFSASSCPQREVPVSLNM